MLFSLPGLLYFLVFAPQCAFSLFEFVAYSRVNQCGNFSVSFSGGKPPAALPLTLTILPINSGPFSVVVPNSAWNISSGSGSFVTPLALPAGSALLASLDDAAGNSAALVSDVIQVQPSANSSCLSSKTPPPAPFRLVTDAVSQCLPFSVSRNTSSVSHPISTRGFIPISLSFKLEWTTYHESQGVDIFTYIMKVAEGLQVALLFDDDQGNRQVSDLLSVQGDESSPNACLQPSSAQSTSAALNSSSQRLSRPAVIAISVSSAVIILITLVLGILFVRRERRKLKLTRFGEVIQKRRNTPLFMLSPLEPPQTEAKPTSPAPVDPVYPMFGVSSNVSESRAARHSTRSTILGPLTPKSRSLRSTKSRSSVNRSIKSIRTKNSTKGSNGRRLADLDIEGLLEVASQQRPATEAPRGYPAASPHTVTPVPTLPPSPSSSTYTFSVVNPIIPRERSRQHPGPDVPLSPLTSVSQDSYSRERPSNPTRTVSSVVSRDNRSMLSSRTRPQPAPFPKPTVFALSKNSV